MKNALHAVSARKGYALRVAVMKTLARMATAAIQTEGAAKVVLKILTVQENKEIKNAYRAVVAG